MTAHHQKIESVFERVARQYENDIGSTDTVDLISEMAPDVVRDCAIRCLEASGVVPEGHPTLVDYAVSGVSTYLLDELRISLSQRVVTRSGRPKVPFHHALIYAAAMHNFRDPKSKRATSRAAATFLGAPATPSRVEKGAKAFIQTTVSLIPYLARHGVSETRAFRIAAMSLSDTIVQLGEAHQAIADEQAKAKQARRNSRFCAPISARLGA